MIKAVIFDIDNTLYNYDEAHEAAFPELCRYVKEQFGWDAAFFEREHKAAYREIREELGEQSAIHNRLIRYQRILEKNGCPLCPHVTAMASLYWTALLDAMVPSEGAAEVFAGLKARGLTIGIGTDMTAYVQFRKLEKLGLLPCVDFVVTSEESGAEKPEKALFELCRKKAGAEAQECLFVGDNPKKDGRGALAAGMQACHVSPDRAAEGEGYVVIRKLKELLQIVP